MYPQAFSRLSFGSPICNILVDALAYTVTITCIYPLGYFIFYPATRLIDLLGRHATP